MLWVSVADCDCLNCMRVLGELGFWICLSYERHLEEAKVVRPSKSGGGGSSDVVVVADVVIIYIGYTYAILCYG